MRIRIYKQPADKIAKENGFEDFTALMNFINGTDLKKYNNRCMTFKDMAKFITFCHLKDADLIKLKVEIKDYGIKKLSE